MSETESTFAVEKDDTDKVEGEVGAEDNSVLLAGDMLLKDQVGELDDTTEDQVGQVEEVMETEEFGEVTQNGTGTEAGETTEEKEGEANADEDVAMKETTDTEKKETNRKILRQITVNIGPLKIKDLGSEQLHQILRMSDGFTMTFTRQPDEKVGYAKIPFVFREEQFLVRVANKLGNLKIEERDMSVNFPEEFNQVVQEIRKKMWNERSKQKEEAAERKRFNYAKNIPPNATEEILKDIFPDCKSVEIPKDESGASLRYAKLEYENKEEALKDFKDKGFPKTVEIGDYKVTVTRQLKTVVGQKGNTGNKGTTKFPKASESSPKVVRFEGNKNKKIEEIKKKYSGNNDKSRTQQRGRGARGGLSGRRGMRGRGGNLKGGFMGKPMNNPGLPMPGAVNPALLQAMTMKMAMNQMGMPFPNQGGMGIMGPGMMSPPPPPDMFERSPRGDHGMDRMQARSHSQGRSWDGRQQRNRRDSGSYGGSLDRDMSRRGDGDGDNYGGDVGSGQGRRNRQRGRGRGGQKQKGQGGSQDKSQGRQQTQDDENSQMTKMVLQLRKQLDQMQRKMQEGEERDKKRGQEQQNRGQQNRGQNKRNRNRRGQNTANQSPGQDYGDQEDYPSRGGGSTIWDSADRDGGVRGGGRYQPGGKRPAAEVDYSYGESPKKRSFGGYPSDDYGYQDRSLGGGSNRMPLDSYDRDYQGSYSKDYLSVNSGYSSTTPSYADPLSTYTSSFASSLPPSAGFGDTRSIRGQVYQY